MRRLINKQGTLIWLVGFGLLLLALALAFWFYRDDLFQSRYDPGRPFQTYTPSPAPDYSQNTAWLMRPDANIDPIHIPGGDVFVVAPTVFLGRTRWNADIKAPKFRENMTRIVLPNYVLPFGAAGRIYAPYYRQAALYTFLTNRDDARLAQKFAYRDVRRAFEAFLKENPPERPIVLVGFGQGGLHVERLLADFFAGPNNAERRRKLAVAYIIDHPLPAEIIRTQMPGLRPCVNVRQTGCIVAFGAFTPSEKTRARRYVQQNLVWDKDGSLKAVAGRPLVCVNPLLWTTGTDYAPARLHKGGVAAEGLGRDVKPAPMPGQTGAQCQDGILLLDKPRQKALRRPLRFGGQFRTLPFNLFYEDLRQDAARRVKTLLDKNILPKRAPLLPLETEEIKDSPVTLPLKPVVKK